MPATAMPASSDGDAYDIGGLLKHAPALLRVLRPDHQQLQAAGAGLRGAGEPGYSQRNRSAACRIPMYSPSPKAKRVEFRCPDPSCNPYLAFAAMLMAGLDGIQNKINPGEPLDKDIYDLPPEERAKVLDAGLAGRSARRARERPRVPAARRRVHRGRDRHLDLTTSAERGRRDALRPHPYEFLLYYDV